MKDKKQETKKQEPRNKKTRQDNQRTKETRYKENPNANTQWGCSVTACFQLFAVYA
jgi:hypothetical protein